MSLEQTSQQDINGIGHPGFASPVASTEKGKPPLQSLYSEVVASKPPGTPSQQTNQPRGYTPCVDERLNERLRAIIVSIGETDRETAAKSPRFFFSL